MLTQTIDFHPTISLVIPIYNVEKFISVCLNSCIAQKNAILSVDYEIIIVNDGSPDNSVNIAYEIIKDKSGCQIINQQNKGLGGARNTGIEHACGDYVWFIDSDDWIAPDALSILIKQIQDFVQPDLIMFRAANVIGDEIKVRQIEFGQTNKLKSGIEVFMNGGLATCAPFQIIRRQLLQENDLKFVEGIFHEDNEFMPRLAYYSKSVAQINEVLYFVYQNPNSITRTINPAKSFDLLKVSDSLSAFSRKHAFKGQFAKRMDTFISLCLNNALNGMLDQDDGIRQSFNAEIFKRKYLFKHLRSSTKIKYIIEGFLFPLCSDYVSVYSFLMIFNRRNSRKAKY